MSLTRSLLITTTALAGASLIHTPAFAQSSSQGLDTIVVTAQKVEENLQSTPLSIAAFAPDQLNEYDVQSPEKLADFVPNVSIGDGTGQGGAGSQVSIRGVSEARVSPVLDPAVGIYIDDVYYGRPQTSFLRLLDVERVEVLRGPQGTLFGKNAVGGAVRYITKKPSFDGDNGYVEVTGGSRNRLDVEGAINLTDGEQFGFRLAGGYLSQDGFVERLSDGEKLGNENAYALSGKLRFNPTDRLDVNIGVDYANSDTDNGPQKLIDYGGFNGAEVPSSATGVGGWNRYWGGTPLAYDVAIPDSLYEVAGEADLAINDVTSVGATLDIVYDVSENTSVRSITGYRNIDQYAFNDPDDQATARTFFGDITERETSFWSTELQINGSYFDDRLTWVGGGYYSVEKPSQIDIFDVDGRNGPPGPDRSAGLVILNDSAFQETKSLGVYTQGTFNVTDQLALTAGIRYTEDDKTYTVSQIATFDFDLYQQGLALGNPAMRTAGGPPNLVVNSYNGGACQPFTAGPGGCVSQAPLTGGGTFDSWTPRFAVEFEPHSNLMLFASASKGFKAGGTNDSVADINTPFEAENVWSYEAGVRSEWFDNRVRLNATGFYSDYTDKQITVTTSPNCVNRCTTNVGDATIKGLEVEFLAAPTNNLDIFANIGLLDAEWETIANASAGVTLDSQFSRAPKFSAAAGLKHTYELGGGSELRSSASVTHKSEQESSPQDSTTLTIPAYTLVNGRLEYRPSQGDWSIAVLCGNCFDKEYITSGAAWAGSTANTIFDYKENDHPAYTSGGLNPNGIAPPSISYVNVGEPRTFAVQVRKDF